MPAKGFCPLFLPAPSGPVCSVPFPVCFQGIVPLTPRALITLWSWEASWRQLCVVPLWKGTEAHLRVRAAITWAKPGLGEKLYWFDVSGKINELKLCYNFIGTS